MQRVSTRVLARLLYAAGAIGLVLVALISLPRQTETPASAATCAPSLPHVSDTTLETIVSSSVTRQYYLQIPPSYTGTTTVPLVFLFHGRSGNAAPMASFTRLNTRADSEGFILVSPQGLPQPPSGITGWNMVLSTAPGATADLQLVEDMLDELESELCIDPLRVYSTGYSAGGMMSVRLACSLSDRIAAVAPVVGVYYPPISTTLAPTETCPDTRPVPVAAFVGEDDLYWPFHGGTSTGIPTLTGLADIEAQTMPNWATHNGCSTTPVMSMPFPGVRLAENPGCADGATTRLYVVEDVDGPGPETAGMGHQWPDSASDLFFPPPVISFGLNTHLMSATDVMWDFFETHPMPQAEPTPSPSPSPEPTPTPVPPPGPFPVGGYVGLVGGASADGGASPIAPVSVVVGLLLLGAGGIYVARMRRDQ